VIIGGGNLTCFGAAFGESAGNGGGGGGACLVVSCARAAAELNIKAAEKIIAQASGMLNSIFSLASRVVFFCFNIWFFDLGKSRLAFIVNDA
jgi:hypothetical protein